MMGEMPTTAMTDPARVGASMPHLHLDHLCRCLAGVFDVELSTFQIETADRRPLEAAVHR
jgi:hypothetical protein